jgi:hypothetical protein
MLNFVRTADSEREVAKGQTRSASSPTTEKLDKAGATASFLCAIHCALMPFVITVLPLLGLGFLASEPVEWGLLASSGTLGTFSLCAGYREHRKRGIFAILAIALALLVAGRILHHNPIGMMGPVLMVVGGFTMMGAHLVNRLLCRSCRVCSDHSCC